MDHNSLVSLRASGYTISERTSLGPSLDSKNVCVFMASKTSSFFLLFGYL